MFVCKNQVRYTVTSVDDKKGTITMMGPNEKEKKVTASVFADSFTKVDVAQVTWLRDSDVQSPLLAPEFSEELLKSSVKAALAKVFEENQGRAKVDVATENKRVRVHAAADYTDDAPLKLVPLSMGIFIASGKAPQGSVLFGKCSVEEEAKEQDKDKEEEAKDQGKDKEEDKDEEEEEEEEDEEAETEDEDERGDDNAPKVEPPKLMFATAPRFKSDKVVVPFWVVGTTADSAKANVKVERVSIPCPGFGKDSAMSVPILVSSGKIEKGREILMHFSTKSSLHKSEEDGLVKNDAKQSSHRIGKGKGGKRRQRR